jgi:hypothetical protein
LSPVAAASVGIFAFSSPSGEKTYSGLSGVCGCEPLMACAKLDMAAPFVRACVLDRPGAAPIAPPKVHCDAPPTAHQCRLLKALSQRAYPACRSVNGSCSSDCRGSCSVGSGTCLMEYLVEFVCFGLDRKAVSNLAAKNAQLRCCCGLRALAAGLLDTRGEQFRWTECGRDQVLSMSVARARGSSPGGPIWCRRPQLRASISRGGKTNRADSCCTRAYRL